MRKEKWKPELIDSSIFIVILLLHHYFNLTTNINGSGFIIINIVIKYRFHILGCHIDKYAQIYKLQIIRLVNHRQFTHNSSHKQNWCDNLNNTLQQLFRCNYSFFYENADICILWRQAYMFSILYGLALYWEWEPACYYVFHAIHHSR